MTKASRLTKVTLYALPFTLIYGWINHLFWMVGFGNRYTPILFLAGLNLFATLYQVSNATASSNIAEWAVKNDVKINSRIVYPHLGEFSHYDWNSKFKVSLAGSQNGEILHEEEVSVLNYIVRKYVLIDTSQ